MYSIRREQVKQPVLPTGPNPLPPLSEFETRKLAYDLSLQVPFGRFAVEIDLKREVGFYEHAFNGLCGQFWLAGHVLVSAEHLLPADVKAALKHVSIELA